jgi:hypothetical protein
MTQHYESGMIIMNYGKIILRLRCLIYEWVRRQVSPQLVSFKGWFGFLRPFKRGVAPVLVFLLRQHLRVLYLQREIFLQEKRGCLLLSIPE